MYGASLCFRCIRIHVKHRYVGRVECTFTDATLSSQDQQLTMGLNDPLLFAPTGDIRNHEIGEICLQPRMEMNLG